MSLGNRLEGEFLNFKICNLIVNQYLKIYNKKTIQQLLETDSVPGVHSRLKLHLLNCFISFGVTRRVHIQVQAGSTSG